MSCPDVNGLVEFVGGGLEDEASRRIEAHLDLCPSCRRVVGELMREPAGEVSATQARFPSTAGSARAGPSAVLTPGQVIQRYEILGVLGQGGMGVVYAAYDPQLDRRVAIKLLRSEVVTPDDAEEMRLRLLREAQAMARLSHPNVVAVYDAGTFEGQLFVVMAHIDGRTLDRWLAERARAWPEILDKFLEAGSGLQAAHSAGLVHRDFKPGNVIVSDDGSAHVTDFGLARSSSAAVPEARFPDPGPTKGSPGPALDSPITRHGQIVGTPLYMAPEQREGRPVDARSDQFGFCVALFEALYGLRPSSAPPHPLPASGGVPGAIRRVVLRGLEREPGRRFPSMAELLVRLRRARGARTRQLAIAVALAATAAMAAAALWRAGSAPPSRPALVVVADARNDTGRRELDHLSAMVITALERSSRVGVLTRNQVVDLLATQGKGEVERIDPDLARQAGVTVNARAVVLPAVRAFGDLTAVDPRTNEAIFNGSSGKGGPSGVTGQVEEVASAFRARLGDEDVAPAAVRAGPNLDAFRYVQEAERHWNRLRLDMAQAAAIEALAVDKDSAQAHYRLATALAWLRRPGAREAIDQAAALADGVPQKDRDLILAFQSYIHGDDVQAIRRWEAVLARFPREKEALWWLADRRYHTLRREEAVSHLERVLSQDPDFAPAREHLLRAQWSTGRLADALQTAREQVRRQGSGMTSHLEAVALARVGRLEEAGRLLRDIDRRADETGSFTLPLVEHDLFVGDLAAAESGVNALLASSRSRTRRAGGRARARVRAVEGRVDEALLELDRVIAEADAAGEGGEAARVRAEKALVLAVSRPQSPLAKTAVADSLAHASQVDREAAWLIYLAAALLRVPADEPFEGRMTLSDETRTAIRAQALCAAERHAEALPLLEAAFRDTGGTETYFFGFLLLRCAAAARDDARVAEAGRRFEALYPDDLAAKSGIRSFLLPWALLFREQAHRSRGEHDAAHTIRARRLTLWKNADPDLRPAASSEAELLRARDQPGHGR